MGLSSVLRRTQQLLHALLDIERDLNVVDDDMFRCMNDVRTVQDRTKRRSRSDIDSFQSKQLR